MRVSAELEAAVTAVIRACRLCEAVRAEKVASAVIKEDRSPVTLADLASQAVISLALANEFPDLPLVAEEETSLFTGAAGEDLLNQVKRYAVREMPDVTATQIVAGIGRGNHPGGPAGRFWTLDPIDGTKGFLRSDQYAVALALIEEGEVVLGVLGCPNLPIEVGEAGTALRGCLFAAVKGEGAWTQPLAGGTHRPIRAAATSDPRDGIVCESFEAGHSSHSEAADIAARLGITAPPIRMDSQCKYGLLARGEVSIYLRLPTRADYEEKIWDHAAGQIVITEAGGQVTDILGRPLDFAQGRTLRSNRGVIATNGLLHARVLAAIHDGPELS